MEIAHSFKQRLSRRCGAFLLLFVSASPLLPAAPFAYVTNNGSYPAFSGTVSVIDTASNTVVGSPIPVGTLPYAVAVTPDGSHVYVGNQGFDPDSGSVSADSSSVSVIDTSTNTVTTTIPHTAGISIPGGIVVSPNGASVYVTNFGTGTVSVIAAATNTISATVPVGNGPGGIAITPDGTTVYVLNQFDGTVSVIATATNTVTGVIAGLTSPTGVVVAPGGQHVYVVNSGIYPAYAGTVSVVATASNTITNTISVGKDPLYAAITPNGASVYVTNSNSGTVSAISTATNSVTATIPVAAVNSIEYLPLGIDITGDGTRIYVVTFADFAVSVINTATGTIIGSPIPVGMRPAQIAIQKPATPAQKVSNLITVLQGMAITGLGASLMEQLQHVEADLTTNNGQVCGDLKAFGNHVNAQTGKKITAAQAAVLLSDVGAIEAALNCGG